MSQDEKLLSEQDRKLLSEIEKKRTNFKTDSYPMSVGELSNLYIAKEIVIRPEFQRLFRWTEGQRVTLIESILLGIPIPSIFVYQGENGIWEVVDGLQRISTILQFMGHLENEDRLKLNGTKYLPSLEGYYYEAKNDDEKELPAALKLHFKRAKLNFSIILSQSDKNAKYEVFQRLNTGGSNASNQEIRNSSMIMLNKDVYDWFDALAKNSDFLDTISLSDRLIDEQYHMELVLRYIALTKFDYDNKKDLGDYLDEINERILIDGDFDYAAVKRDFEDTFGLLNSALGEKSFKKFDGTDFKGKFLESAFEAIAVGLGTNIDSYRNLFDDGNSVVATKIKALYHEDIFMQNTGSGSNAKTRIPRIVPFAKEFFRR